MTPEEKAERIKESKIKYKKSDTYKKYKIRLSKSLRKKYKESAVFRNRIIEYQKSPKYKSYLKKRQSSEEFKKYQREYVKKRRRENIQFKLASRLRIRLNESLRGNYKKGSAIKDLGCSVLKLKEHLEKKFEKGMNWSNHGLWHIDHIKPLSSFNLTDRSELLDACNYKNLQPLWANDNLLKGEKI